MELVTPDIGLLFWMLLSFSIVLLILRKFAWKPILQALQDREDSISKALSNAEIARHEVANLKSQKDQILNEAKQEREAMMKEAKDDIGNYKIEQKSKIDQQFKLKMDTALDEITQQKRAALDELKETVATLSVDIAEKILKKELENSSRHDAMIKETINDIRIK